MKKTNWMFVQRFTIIFSVVLFFGSTNLAVAEENSTTIRSVGAQSCKDVVAILTEKVDDRVVAALYVQWLSGFVSAYNIDNKIFDAFPIRAPGDELLRFFVALCAVNTDINFVNVVVAGLKAIEPFHAVRPDDLISVEAEGTKYEFYRQYIKASQLYLKGKGQRVVADGSFGALTKAEIRKYKNKNNLPGPPVPDFTFLLSMIENKK
jgi:hypothetical protein